MRQREVRLTMLTAALLSVLAWPSAAHADDSLHVEMAHHWHTNGYGRQVYSVHATFNYVTHLEGETQAKVWINVYVYGKFVRHTETSTTTFNGDGLTDGWVMAHDWGADGDPRKVCYTGRAQLRQGQKVVGPVSSEPLCGGGPLPPDLVG